MKIDELQLEEGEVIIDAWDAPVPDTREYVSCRITRPKSGIYSGQYFDTEDDEWIEDGDLNPIWMRRIADLIAQPKRVRSFVEDALETYESCASLGLSKVEQNAAAAALRKVLRFMDEASLKEQQ